MWARFEFAASWLTTFSRSCSGDTELPGTVGQPIPAACQRLPGGSPDLNAIRGYLYCRTEQTVSINVHSWNPFIHRPTLVSVSMPRWSPRDCFGEAFSYGFLMHEEVWVQMIQDQNLSVHTDNEDLAD
jgi:hypothetical protein